MEPRLSDGKGLVPAASGSLFQRQSLGIRRHPATAPTSFHPNTRHATQKGFWPFRKVICRLFYTALVLATAARDRRLSSSHSADKAHMVT